MWLLVICNVLGSSSEQQACATDIWEKEMETKVRRIFFQTKAALRDLSTTLDQEKS